MIEEDSTSHIGFSTLSKKMISCCVVGDNISPLKQLIIDSRYQTNPENAFIQDREQDKLRRAVRQQHSILSFGIGERERVVNFSQITANLSCKLE